ncbi:SDR family oxidoreductase [Nocardioides dongkuii]|uniref:SDR family oxidoreductase n=1 Tax=Nocardioides dongkuii TaxID=2760089 RepID=UPI0015F7FBEC|nr:SDR family oxidoreductase [Nocardioides dongkuii]
MGTYAVTGAASGMGREVVDRLRAAGHTTITVDLRDADVVADLATPAGRRTAVAGVLARAAGSLDGAVLAAGVGPVRGREELIAQVNYVAPTELLLAWRDTLAATAAGTGVSSKVVVFGSNSASVTPGIPGALVAAHLHDRPGVRARLLKVFGPNAAAFAYGGSKLALSRWVRRTAVAPEWAGSGIRLNAIAPGAIMTPLLQTQLDGPDRDRIESFPVPVGGLGDAGQIAEWAVFMLSPAADFLCGSVVYVDGGTDAYFRGSAWPASSSMLSVPRWLLRSRAFAKRAVSGS